MMLTVGRLLAVQDVASLLYQGRLASLRRTFQSTAPTMTSFKPDLSSRLSSLALIFVAAAVAPPVIFSVLLVTAYHRVSKRVMNILSPAQAPTNQSTKRAKPMTAIVTGGKMTKALHAARILKAAGCRVVMLETHKYWMVASRFAKCVDRFVTVPVPEKEPEAYQKAIKVLAYEENADLFVPVSSPVASLYDSRVARVLPPSCRSLASSEVITALLDDKVTFAEMAKAAGCTSPDSRRMESKDAVRAFNEQLREQGPAATRYILKNLAYDSMRRLDLFALPCDAPKLEEYMCDLTITPQAPWLVQEFIKGNEYSTCAIAHEGALALFTDNAASISCFNYEPAREPQLREWVERFCKHHQISGIVCIDFFITPDGRALAIECNPRFSSNITNFYDSPTVGRAFVDPEACAAAGRTETPMPTAKETNWLAVDIVYALTKPGYTLAQRAAQIYECVFEKKDAYFEPDDVLPFLALHFVHIPMLLARNVWRGNKWAKIDMCIGKLTEENGD